MQEIKCVKTLYLEPLSCERSSLPPPIFTLRQTKTSILYKQGKGTAEGRASRSHRDDDFWNINFSRGLEDLLPFKCFKTFRNKFNSLPGWKPNYYQYYISAFRQVCFGSLPNGFVLLKTLRHSKPCRTSISLSALRLRAAIVCRTESSYSAFMKVFSLTGLQLALDRFLINITQITCR